jgi:hypothetical protein
MPKKRRGSKARITVQEELPGVASEDSKQTAGEPGLPAPAKRRGPDRSAARESSAAAAAAAAVDDVENELVFEDPYEDEFESDGEVVDGAVEDGGEGGAEGMEELEEQLRVWRPGIDKLGDEEVPRSARAHLSVSIFKRHCCCVREVLGRSESVTPVAGA